MLGHENYQLIDYKVNNNTHNYATRYKTIVCECGWTGGTYHIKNNGSPSKMHLRHWGGHVEAESQLARPDYQKVLVGTVITPRFTRNIYIMTVQQAKINGYTIRRNHSWWVNAWEKETYPWCSVENVTPNSKRSKLKEEKKVISSFYTREQTLEFVKRKLKGYELDGASVEWGEEHKPFVLASGAETVLEILNRIEQSETLEEMQQSLIHAKNILQYLDIIRSKCKELENRVEQKLLSIAPHDKNS